MKLKIASQKILEVFSNSIITNCDNALSFFSSSASGSVVVHYPAVEFDYRTIKINCERIAKKYIKKTVKMNREEREREKVKKK